MKKRRSLFVWSAFTLCALLVLGAMAWLTRGVLAAESQRAHAEAEREAAEVRADLEERTRLALWRMDAAGSALMLRENRHNTTHSPLPDPPEVLLRFEAHHARPLHFPALEKNLPERAQIEARIVRFRALLAAHPLPGGEWQLLQSAAFRSQSNWSAVNQDTPPPPNLDAAPTTGRASIQKQANTNQHEKIQRARAIDEALEAAHNAPQSTPMVESASPTTQTAPMLAVWLGQELLLLRPVTQAQKTIRLEGVWLDWQVLAAQLLSKIPDLLPHAKLIPADGNTALQSPLTLVSFPLRLIRSDLPASPSPLPTVTLTLPLRIAWAAVLFALFSAALLAAGIMRLSDRRASFVSAVTHELRTPLTTFRLYSDLLAQKAVSEEKQAQYVNVLTREAERLTHLVENVLAFSRIENGGAGSKKRTTTLGEMFEEFRLRFEDRLATAGLSLKINLTDEAATAPLFLDPSLVEHLLFNLIDNAAKYALPANPPLVDLEGAQQGNQLEIMVRDHGPGIPDDERRRIFKPFHKSALAAAESQPGVGLGLALSTRLAHALGGSLEVTPASQGACFTLKIPLRRSHL